MDYYKSRERFKNFPQKDNSFEIKYKIKYRFYSMKNIKMHIKQIYKTKNKGLEICWKLFCVDKIYLVFVCGGVCC